MARPTIYSQAIADQICERLIEGESLRRIGKRVGMPSASTVVRWLATNDDFRAQYALAREAQADTLADEAVFIADTPKTGKVARTKTHTVSVEVDGAVTSTTTTETASTVGDMLGHRRLQVDARRWYAAKLNPKKYGDKLELGGQVGLKQILPDPLSEDEWLEQHAPK
jgi:hypothetical protein